MFKILQEQEKVLLQLLSLNTQFVMACEFAKAKEQKQKEKLSFSSGLLAIFSMIGRGTQQYIRVKEVWSP